MFNITLTNITGGAQLIQPSTASLTILANDYPVTISPSILHINEGETGVLFIRLNKSFSESINVYVQTIPTNVSVNDFISVNQTVTFSPGETKKSITVQTVDDDIPERDESFLVVLLSSMGDTVLFTNFTSSVVIKANDDPHGVFEFDGDLQREIAEGKTLKIRFVTFLLVYKKFLMVLISFFFFFFFFFCKTDLFIKYMLVQLCAAISIPEGRQFINNINVLNYENFFFFGKLFLSFFVSYIRTSSCDCGLVVLGVNEEINLVFHLPSSYLCRSTPFFKRLSM